MRGLGALVTAWVGLGLGAVAGGLVGWDGRDPLPSAEEMVVVAETALPEAVYEPGDDPGGYPAREPDLEWGRPRKGAGVLLWGDETVATEQVLIAEDAPWGPPLVPLVAERLAAAGWEVLSQGPVGVHLYRDGLRVAFYSQDVEVEDPYFVFSARTGAGQVLGALLGAPFGAAAALWVGRLWRGLDGGRGWTFRARAVGLALLLPSSVVVWTGVVGDWDIPLWRAAWYWFPGLGAAVNTAALLLLVSLVGSLVRRLVSASPAAGPVGGDEATEARRVTRGEPDVRSSAGPRIDGLAGGAPNIE